MSGLSSNESLLLPRADFKILNTVSSSADSGTSAAIATAFTPIYFSSAADGLPAAPDHEDLAALLDELSCGSEVDAARVPAMTTISFVKRPSSRFTSGDML
jgi:hypothetical protein